MNSQFIKNLKEFHNNFSEIKTSINAFIKLFFFLFCGIGILLVMRYCSNLRYFPSDITFGDTLLFIWVSVGFAFFAGMMLLMFLFVAGFFLGSIRLIIRSIEIILKKTFYKIPKINYTVILPFIFIGPFISLFLWLIIVKTKELFYPIIISEIGIISFLVLFFIKPSKAPQKFYYLLFGCAAIFFIFFTNGEFFDFNINTVMKIIGIRIPEANIAIEKEFAESIDAIIKDRGMNNSKIITKGDYHIYNANVLFTGIGGNNLIEFSDGGKNFKLILSKTKMIISYK